MTSRSRSWMNLSFPPFKSRTGLASIVPKRHPAPFSRAAYPHAATFSGVSVNCRFFSTNTNSTNAVLIIRSEPPSRFPLATQSQFDFRAHLYTEGWPFFLYRLIV